MVAAVAIGTLDVIPDNLRQHIENLFIDNNPPVNYKELHHFDCSLCKSEELIILSRTPMVKVHWNIKHAFVYFKEKQNCCSFNIIVTNPLEALNQYSHSYRNCFSAFLGTFWFAIVGWIMRMRAGWLEWILFFIEKGLKCLVV